MTMRFAAWIAGIAQSRSRLSRWHGSARVAILIPQRWTRARLPTPPCRRRKLHLSRQHLREAADPKSFTTTGPLVAEQQADIAAERNGRMVSINVRIGDRVKKGQLLAQLDDRALKSACESQKARVASAQAQLREWQSEQLTAEADLRRADAMRDTKIISEENWEHAKYRVDETIAKSLDFAKRPQHRRRT